MHTRIATIIIMLLMTLRVMSSDFSSNGIFYNILSASAHTVEVTYHESSDTSGNLVIVNNYYSGDITIPETVEYNGATYSVVSVADGIFKKSGQLTSVTLPASIVSLGNEPFAQCYKLTSVNVADNNPYYSSRDGVLFNKSQTTLINYPTNRKGSYTIPASVTKIASKAFCECGQLTSVTLPQSLFTIGDSAFFACRSLTTIKLPSATNNLGKYAFAGCSNIQFFSVEGANMNYTIVNGVLFDKSTSHLICFPAGRGGRYTIPGSVRTIDEAAFFQCIHLEAVDMPESLTTISGSAFYECSGLNSLLLPNQTSFIGHKAFSGCNNLRSIVSSAPTPPHIFADTFSEAQYSNTVKVPTECANNYHNALGWNLFESFTESYNSAMVAEPLTLRQGKQTLLHLYFDSGDNPVYGMTFYLFLPEGLRLKTTSDGQFLYTLPEELSDKNIQVDIEENEGVYSFTIYGQESFSINGTSLINLLVIASESASIGECYGKISEILSYGADMSITVSNDINFCAKVQPALQYDLDGDGQVSLIDIMILVEDILEQ